MIESGWDPAEGETMFLASRGRRVIVVLIPAVASLLFALMSFFIMRSNPENVADWRLLFWITLAVGLVCCFGALLVPEKTKKRERFDALAPMQSQFVAWHYENRRQGKVKVKFYLIMLATAEDIYFSDDIAKNILKVMNAGHEEGRLVPMIEHDFVRSISNKLDKVAIHQISAIRANAHSLVVTTANGELHYRLSSWLNHEQVAATIAAATFPGVAGQRIVEQREVGMVRKKAVDEISIYYGRADQDEARY